MLKSQRARLPASNQKPACLTTARPALVTRGRMTVRGLRRWRFPCAILSVALLLCAASSFAHPMGNFSISHYAGIRVEQGYIEVRYILDEAEIPTFQEIQRTGIVPKQDDPSLAGYLSEQADAMKAGLRLELDGRPVALETISNEAIFPAGAGGLPTMKLGFGYRA